MDDPVRVFYDALAATYHLIFADWEASLRRQAAALQRIITVELGEGPLTILDCACGIGTQAIGLALLGYHVQATDLSPAAVARAEREARALGASLSFGVADIRVLASELSGVFDVVIAADNALPHLLDERDLRQGIVNMAAKLRPGGLLLASIRDYDRLVQERPRSEGPRVFDGIDGRRITFQVWDWAADGRAYELHQFIVQQDGEAWRTQHFATPYRALLRQELETALRAARLRDIRWHEPEESGFFQPIVTARSESEASLQCGDRASRERSGEERQEGVMATAVRERTTQGEAAHEQTIARYRDYVATSFVASIEPVAVASAEGATVWDQDGREYVDCFAGIAVVNAGHRHPKVIAAAKAQMDQFVHAATYVYHVPVVGELGEKLAEITPGRLSKTFFGNSGAEGIETAMRLAKAYTGKREFITLTHSFHGRTAGTLSITGNKARKTRGGPYLPGIAFAPAPYVYRNPFGTDDAEEVAERCAAMIEWAIDYQSSGDVAAFIAEPVMGEGGILVPPASYFQRVKEILDRHGILFIADEVQSGYGRTGTMFAVEHFGIEPDIMVLAKGIADGFPLSATVATPEIADSLRPGEHLSTFGGNPVSCAAGVANIEVMVDERLPEESARKGGHAMARLRAMADEHPLIGEVRGLGLMIGVELVKDRATKEPASKEAAAIRRLAREAGVLIGVGGQLGNVVRIQPPLVIEDAALDHALDVVENALRSVEQS